MADLDKKEKCPSCEKEVEFIEFECDEPFTAPAELAYKALNVWGALSAPKEQICRSETKDGKFVHFKFLGNNTERLVKMLGFDREKFTQNLENLQAEKKTCQHTDKKGESACSALGSPIFTMFEPDNPIAYYCDDHCFENGACQGCYMFLAGWESFDFSQSGFCDDCEDVFQREFREDGDEEYNYGDGDEF